MNYRKLGETGLMVSEIGAGVEGFIGKTAAQVQEMITVMEQTGINFIDFYSPDPTMLKNVGLALKGRRDKFILQQHLCSVWKNGQYLRTRNTEETRNAFEERLRLIGTDHFEIGMIHYCDSLSDWQTIVKDILPLAHQLKDSGRIEHIGLSSHNPEVALAALEEGSIEVLMFSVNPCYDLQPAGENVEDLWADEAYATKLTNMDPQRQKLYEECERHGVGIDVMKAFGGGDLLHADLSPAKIELTPYECIAYALSRPGVASVMAGARTADEFRDDAAYEEASPQQKDYATALTRMPLISWKGNCMYCGHCAPCPKEIDIAEVTRFLNLAKAKKALSDEENFIPETVREHYKVLKHHASECIQCGACEKRCPFEVPVRENMKQAVKLFGY